MWDTPFFACPGQNVPGSEYDFFGVCPDQIIGTLGDRYRSFRILAQGDAGDAEHGSFFLDAAGVGDCQCCILDKLEEIQIALGFRNDDAGRGEQLIQHAESLHIVACSGVEGENELDIAGNFVQALHKRLQGFGAVHIGRAMQGDQGVCPLNGKALLDG